MRPGFWGSRLDLVFSFWRAARYNSRARLSIQVRGCLCLRTSLCFSPGLEGVDRSPKAAVAECNGGLGSSSLSRVDVLHSVLLVGEGREAAKEGLTRANTSCS